MKARAEQHLKPYWFHPGVSGNPGGRPKVYVAAQLAREVFEGNFPEIKTAFSKLLRKCSPYAFQVLSDRAYGKLQEVHKSSTGLSRTCDEDLDKRIAELKAKLGVTDITHEPKVLLPADDPKPN